ncbi:EI24 domain-containing protein [Solidesulfovibrio sp.]|uniref:EI24 domain-containing protein n=1 Tax=Solidesulfovibrio sp. TaxID=2910990 RepID=UPI0026360E15|nr:EI24 domain-containing protein [Solidesulfovibrio sp.]
MLTAFPRAVLAHARGIRFAFAHKGYLLLALVPFLLTLGIFTAGFWLFAASGDRILAFFWSPEASAAGGFLGALYWLYVHVAKYLLYLLAVALMYFLFMVTANILASPLYDVMAGRMLAAARGGKVAEAGLPWWRVMAEEVKKAVFVAAVPVLLVFVPVVGQFLAPVAAAGFLAFDFMDFAFCREEPRFATRLRRAAGRPMTLLGFGAPLLIPIVNIVLFPFAICGATLLYLDTLGQDAAESKRP